VELHLEVCENWSSTSIAWTQKGRDGSNRSAKDDANINALKDFFQFVETLASPRATRLVKALSKTGENTCELRDNDDELIELPTYLSKRGLYKKFLSNNGYIYSSDAVGRITTTALTSSQGNDEDEDVTPRLPTPPSYRTFMRCILEDEPRKACDTKAKRRHMWRLLHLCQPNEVPDQSTTGDFR